MPYRTPGGSRPSGTSMRTLRRAGSTLNHQTDYGYDQTAVRRHEFVSQHDSEFVSSILAANAYQQVDMLRFKRSFSSSVADVEPTPTNGNNFQSTAVMNGSLVRDFSKVIQIKNRESNDGTSVKGFSLDIYQLAFSFWDADIYEKYATNAGVDEITEFDDTNSSVNAGEVIFDATHPTFTSNGIKNSKFLQRYVKLLGTIEIPQGETIHLNVNRIPPRCRRSNNGMFWGLIFHNDTVKNDGATFVGSISSETSFKELPSQNRLPFLY